MSHSVMEPFTSSKHVATRRTTGQRTTVHPFYLVLLYIFVVSLPLVISGLAGLPPRPLRQEVASSLGILAFSIILAEFVLSGRFKSVSKSVGMDVTMRLHQLMARTALAFALLHPLLYGGTPSGGHRPWDPTRQLTLTTDFTDLSSGIMAFLLLPALVLLAIGRAQMDHKYEIWRLFHGVGAFLLAILLLHHTVSAGRYGSRPEMVWLWSVMTALAVGSLLYVYFVVPLLKSKRPWVVHSVTQLSPRQWELTIKPDGHAGLDFQAGQFAWLAVGKSPFSLHENPFSICSAPKTRGAVSFMIKELGDFTSTIGELQVGSVAYLNGPFGSLCVDGRSEPGIGLIAGGVGLAPLLSILRQLRMTNDCRRSKLIYGNRTVDQIAFKKELDTAGVIYALQEPPPNWNGATGFINATVLDRAFTPAEFKEWVFVVCGPIAMLDHVEEHLLQRGADANRILTERFDYD